MTEVVNIKVEGVVDELILNSMQVLNQAFYQASAINQAEEYALVFEFQEEVKINAFDARLILQIVAGIK